MKNRYWNYSLAVMLLVIMLNQYVITKTINRVPSEVIEHMATRKMRYHHFLWHQIRNLWNLLDPETQEKIRHLGWAPPRPALTFGEYGEAIAEEYNNSGEDFLNMHYVMIGEVNKIIQKRCLYHEIQGFQTIPSPEDTEYPALPTYELEGDENIGTNYVIQYIKSDEFYYTQIKPYEDFFTNEEVLRSMSLGQLGSQIEFTLHNWMHIRFSEKCELGLRPDYGEVMPKIDHMWDDPKYDTLLDTYSAHVNPRFWMIHGWVNDRIEAWRKANGLEKIEWQGTWTGGDMGEMNDIICDDPDCEVCNPPDGDGVHDEIVHVHDHMDLDYEDGSRMMQMTEDHDDDMEDKMDHHMMHMEKVMELLLATGKCQNYERQVKLTPLLYLYNVKKQT